MKSMMILSCILVLLASSALCFGYINSHTTGSPLPGFSARSTGLGGVRSIGLGDGSSMLTNPAGLQRTEGTLFSLSIGPGIGSETVMDSLGQHPNNWITFGNLFASMKFQLDPRFNAGIAFGKVSDFSYIGAHYTYDFQSGNEDYLTEIIDFTVSGGMYESVAGLSFSASDWINLGLSAGLRFGGVSYDSTFTDVEAHENDTLISWKRDFNEFCWHCGIEIPLNNVLIGFSWASEGDSYDARAAFGGLLYLDDDNRSAMGGEVEVGDPGGINSIYARVFGFAFPSNSFELRGSFNFAMPNYEEVESSMIIGLALGSGIYLGDIILDGGIAWYSSSRDSVFLGTGRPDDISDSQALISLGITWKP
ncbi:MAG: hypothetical protein KAW14_12580 [Candidatus Aegiribacteria sp.]|nr:hypothetical protein [Candidatus Aegiribacteria sp.]